MELGRRVREFRTTRKWSTARMAKEVGTSRQNIENLEKKEFAHPHYIADLARVMGTTVDELLGQDAPVAGPGDAEPSAGEWAHLLEYREAAAAAKEQASRLLRESAEQMRVMRREAMQRLGLPSEPRPGEGLPPTPRAAKVGNDRLKAGGLSVIKSAPPAAKKRTSR